MRRVSDGVPSLNIDDAELTQGQKQEEEEEEEEEEVEEEEEEILVNERGKINPPGMHEPLSEEDEFGLGPLTAFRSRFHYNEKMNRIIFHKYQYEMVTLTNRAWAMMGMKLLDGKTNPRQHIPPGFKKWIHASGKDKKLLTLHYAPRFDLGIETMHVYTDLVKRSYLSNSNVNILRIISMSHLMDKHREAQSGASHHHMEFKKLQYIPVIDGLVRNNAVMLCAPSGEMIDFYGGITTLSLKFIKH